MTISARKYFLMAFLAIVGVVATSVLLAKTVHPVLGVGAAGWLYAFIAWLVCCLITAGTRRPFAVVDAVRCTGWIVVGYSEGVREFGGIWLFLYYPQHRPLVHGCSVAGVIIGLFTVVLATLLLPKPAIPVPGHCDKCGYDLTGNTSGVCPECGAAASVNSVASVPSCSNKQEKTEVTELM